MQSQEKLGSLAISIAISSVFTLGILIFLFGLMDNAPLTLHKENNFHSLKFHTGFDIYSEK